MITLSWQIGGVVVLAMSAVLTAGKMWQRQSSFNERIKHLEDLLSWSGDKGPAFVHKSLFEMQNTHNEQMMSELRDGLKGLEVKLDQKLDETNKLLSDIASAL